MGRPLVLFLLSVACSDTPCDDASCEGMNLTVHDPDFHEVYVAAFSKVMSPAEWEALGPEVAAIRKGPYASDTARPGLCKASPTCQLGFPRDAGVLPSGTWHLGGALHMPRFGLPLDASANVKCLSKPPDGTPATDWSEQRPFTLEPSASGLAKLQTGITLPEAKPGEHLWCAWRITVQPTDPSPWENTDEARSWEGRFEWVGAEVVAAAAE